jgi:glycosyltransferase involved in cell wall biosynthesis
MSPDAARSRILLWSDLFWPYMGGIEKLSLDLIRALRPRGLSFSVLTSHFNLDLPDAEDWEGIAIRRVPFRRALEQRDLMAMQSAQATALQVVRAFKPHVLHLNGIGPSAFFFRRVRAETPARTLVSVHQEFFQARTADPSSLTYQILAVADWIHAVSTPVLAQVRELIPASASRSSAIFNFAEPTALDPEPLRFAAPHLLCLGRLVPQKGFDLALRALPEIRSRFPQVRLTIAGDGESRPQLEALTDELGLRAAVEFVGWVAPAAVAHILNQATIVMMPSRHEGLPLVAIEAAGMARPIIATRTGGMPDIVVHGHNGLLIPHEDPQALVRAVCALLASPDLAQRMGHAGQARTRTLFRKEGVVAQYESLYRRLAVAGDAPGEEDGDA